MLNSICRTTNPSVHTKIKIFRSNVLSVHIYGVECWKTTVTIQRKLEMFQTKWTRCILRIYWPNTISNEELRNRTGMDTLTEITQTHQWRWLGHVRRMPSNSITKTALRWTPRGKTKRGRPSETWWHSMKKDPNIRGMSLEMTPRAAAD